MPAATPVPKRAPIAPKIVPRMPTEAGMSTRRPGSFSRVPVIEPRTSPATNPAQVLRTSATEPCRRVRRSERQ